MDPRISNPNIECQPYLAEDHKYLLPERYQRPFLGLSITLIVLGTISIIMGGVGFAGYNYKYNPSVFTGQDFWVGLFVSKL